MTGKYETSPHKHSAMVCETDAVFSVGFSTVGSQLFAVTGSSRCAESLPYGPFSVTEDSAPYVSTLLKYRHHDVWQQVLTGSGVALGITWQFSNVKSLQDRFHSAVTYGESVTWTVRCLTGSVRCPVGFTTTKTGTWRFSHNAGDVRGKFSSSGSGFSKDDGLWGAGSGIVDGNGYAPSEFWGHGNHNSGDSLCQYVYLDGSRYVYVTRNLMYIAPIGHGSGELTDYDLIQVT